MTLGYNNLRSRGGAAVPGRLEMAGTEARPTRFLFLEREQGDDALP